MATKHKSQISKMAAPSTIAVQEQVDELKKQMGGIAELLQDLNDKIDATPKASTDQSSVTVGQERDAEPGSSEEKYAIKLLPGRGASYAYRGYKYLRFSPTGQDMVYGVPRKVRDYLVTVARTFTDVAPTLVDTVYDPTPLTAGKKVIANPAAQTQVNRAQSSEPTPLSSTYVPKDMDADSRAARQQVLKEARARNAANTAAAGTDPDGERIELDDQSSISKRMSTAPATGGPAPNYVEVGG